jgi:predicted Zn-dependent peptidase
LLTKEDARLDLAARLLSGVQTAWLYWKLVDEKKVASRVSTRQHSSALGSEFEITLEAAPGRSAAELLGAYDTAMSELRPRLATRDELSGCVDELTTHRRMALEEPADRAYEMSQFTRLVGTPDYFTHDVERFTTATAAQVRDTIERWLPADRRVVVLVTPKSDAPPGGERTGRRFTAAKEAP